VDRIASRSATVDLQTAPTLVAVGIVLAVVILSVAVAIVIVRGSRSAKEPDRYALQVLNGLPNWLWPWRFRASTGEETRNSIAPRADE
jgi:hypothetical protein